MYDTISKDLGKEEPEKSECSMDFRRSKGGKRNINIVTRGGTKTGNDTVQQEPAQNQWVKKNIEPRKQFDSPKEKETFKEARQ
jgi:hypothetical protein